MIDATRDELLLIIEALAMAASRHESSGHVTRGRFRYQHDHKAERMRKLRARLLAEIREIREDEQCA